MWAAVQVAAAENFVSKNLSEVRKPSALLSSIIKRYAEGGDVSGHDAPGGAGGGAGGGFARCAAPGSRHLAPTVRAARLCLCASAAQGTLASCLLCRLVPMPCSSP